MDKKPKLQFNEIDKRAIRENQQAMVNFFGTGKISDAYDKIVELRDYDQIAFVSPIFKKLSECYDEYGFLIDYSLDDKVDEINQEIYDFFNELPTLKVNLDCDTFYKKYKNGDLYSFDDAVAGNYSFSTLLESLLESKELTKDEKNKVLSVVYKL